MYIALDMWLFIPGLTTTNSEHISEDRNPNYAGLRHHLPGVGGDMEINLPVYTVRKSG